MSLRRVAHIIGSGGFYGAERVILTLATCAPSLAMMCSIVCFEETRRPNLELYSRATAAGVDAKRLPCNKRFDISALRDLVGHLKELKVDLVHTHGLKGNVYGLMAARKLGLPIVGTVHLWSPSPFIVRFYNHLDAFVIRFFDRVVAVSAEIAADMARKKIPQRLIRTIRNGIDITAMTPGGNADRSTIHRELEIQEQAPVIGVVGRLAPEKGHHFLLEAAQTVLRSFPETAFVIVGGGPLEESLKAYTRKLGIANSVRFAGARENMRQFYAAFDLLVSSSLAEGTPMVLLEAMAMARPVIATCVGGVPSLVRNNETGLLIPPRDPEALARAMLELLQDKARRGRLALAGQRLIHDQFSAEKMAAAYKAVYEETWSENLIPRRGRIGAA